MSPAGGITAAQARAQHEFELDARRSAEHACALDFMVYGDGEAMGVELQVAYFHGHRVQAVTHAERCVFGPRHACSHTYDPMPYDEAEPVDAKLYEGTRIGALYGLPGCEDVVLNLEGWELAPRTVFE